MAIQRILIGVDGSEGATVAMEWVVDLAHQTGASVTVVYAIGVDGREPGDEVDRRFHDAGRRSLNVQLEYWCLPLRKAGVDYQARLEDGLPAPAILEVAQEVAADLIVVGRRGRGGLTQLLLGSVSHALVQTASLPVVVLGPKAQPGKT